MLQLLSSRALPTHATWLLLRSTVAGRRLLDTLCNSQRAPRPAASAALAPPTSVQHATSSVQQQGSEAVLGVLTSLLQQQQQQQQQVVQATLQEQQQPDSPHGPTVANAAMDWAAASSELLSTQTCQSDLSAASSGQVRMESQLVFDSCWRRFREKRGTVSCLAGPWVLFNTHQLQSRYAASMHQQRLT